MAWLANMSPRNRRSALAVGMLGVLLLGTAAAWLITAGRSGARPGEQWYLIRGADGAPVAWEVVQRSADGRQGYHVLGGAQSAGIVSQWRLDADAAKGRYVSAAAIAANRRGQTVYRFTGIDYDGEAVKLRQWVLAGGGRRQVVTRSQRVDDLYIPEGRLRSVVAAVARSGEQVLRTIVRDELLRVVPLVLSPGELVQRRIAGRQRTVTPVTVTYELQVPDDTSIRYYVAEDGSIPLREELDGDTVVSVVEI